MDRLRSTISMGRANRNGSCSHCLQSPMGVSFATTSTTSTYYWSVCPLWNNSNRRSWFIRRLLQYFAATEKPQLVNILKMVIAYFYDSGLCLEFSQTTLAVQGCFLVCSLMLRMVHSAWVCCLKNRGQTRDEQAKAIFTAALYSWNSVRHCTVVYRANPIAVLHKTWPAWMLPFTWTSRTGLIEYQFRHCDANEWDNYGARQELKSHREFLPATPVPTTRVLFRPPISHLYDAGWWWRIRGCHWRWKQE
jgi:hypothetical protein